MNEPEVIKEKIALVKKIDAYKKENEVSLAKACEAQKVSKSNYSYWKVKYLEGRNPRIPKVIKALPTIHEPIEKAKKYKLKKESISPTGKVAIIFCYAGDVERILGAGL